MRILLVVEHFSPFVGGVATVFEELGRVFAGLGHQVTVVTTKLPGTPAREEWQGMAIDRVWTPPFSRRYWFTFLALPAIWRQARTAAVIQTTTYNAALPSWLVASLLKKPIFVTVHEVWGARWLTYPIHRALALTYLWFEAQILRLPYTALVAVSQATAVDLQALTGRQTRRVEIIYNGIDQAHFRPLPEAPAVLRQRLGLPAGPLLLYYGRPGVSKGVEVLVRALEIYHLDAKTKPLQALFLLAPDPADRYQAIRRQIAAAGLESTILVRDPVSRDLLPAYIQAASWVVIPSLAEGFGLSAVEACAMAKPVVVTSAGSLPEVVFGQVILTPPGDASALATALSQARAGQFTKIAQKQFTWRKSAQAYLQLYREYL